MDFLVDQFRSVLGQNLVLAEATGPTLTGPMLVPSPAQDAALMSPRGLSRVLRTIQDPLPPLESEPTRRTGPPRDMPLGTGLKRVDSEPTVRTGPPAEMTPPPRHPPAPVPSPKQARSLPARLPPLSSLGDAPRPRDLVPTAVLRPPRRVDPDADTVPAIPLHDTVEDVVIEEPSPEIIVRARRFLGTDTTDTEEDEERLYRTTDRYVPLPRSSAGTDPELPYASLEIVESLEDGVGNRGRSWPRVVLGLGLALAILAL